MLKSPYQIVFISDGLFELYENGYPRVKFKRENIRKALSSLSISSNQIGAILRQLNKKFPAPPQSQQNHRTPFERVLFKYKEQGLADYLRAKGLRVTQEIDGISDKEIIAYLESRGYEIDGILNECFYSTRENRKTERNLQPSYKLL